MKLSCVMGTGRRKPFLKQAIKCFLRQTYLDKELVIVDDDPESAQDLVPGDSSIRCLQVPSGTPIGRKMNLGIVEATGELIQKLDDDDYYAPDFLARMAEAREAYGVHAIGGMNCAMVLITSTGQLKFSGYDWFFGNSFCFTRKLWEEKPFREDVIKCSDAWFLRDHPDSAHVRLSDPELCMIVRHGCGHTWKSVYGVPFEELFGKHRTDYPKKLEDVIPADDLPFYLDLIARKGEIA